MKNNPKKTKKEKPIKCSKRIFIFIVTLIPCFLIALAKLIEYQIVDYDKYNKILHSSNQIKKIVPAARGDIVDRNGVVLATNELNLSLIIGEKFPLKNVDDDKETAIQKNKQGNAIILKLINILEKEGIDWEEHSPISKTKPYSFLEDKNYEIEKLKKALSQQQYATAKDAIDLLAQTFDIDKTNYTEKQIRDIAVFRANMLIKSFSEYNKTFVVLEKVEPEFLDKIAGKGETLKGVEILETTKRIYPFKEIGAHLFGNVGPIYKEDYDKYRKKGYPPNAIVGKFGIEEKFEEQLKATDGVLVLQKDEEGNTINRYYEKEPKPGNTVQLSIDIYFQKALQEGLPKFMNTHHLDNANAKGAGLVVENVKDGGLLACISYPSFDLNEYNKNYEKLSKEKICPLRNRAFVEIYRPGSSFKPFIALTALMCGAITPSTKFLCRDGIMPHMTCFHLFHKGIIDIYTAIQRSCNNYFYQVGEKLGIDNIVKYAPYFGFGVDTGFELYNSNGRVTNPSKEFQRRYNYKYQHGDLWQTAIGQSEVYDTVLQQAVYMQTFASKGERLAPFIVQQIRDPNNNIIFNRKRKVMSEIDIPDFAHNTVTEGMVRMWNSKPINSKNPIACKSGSPQYSSSNKSLTNGAGVALYPSSSPEISISILVENGKSAENYVEQTVNFYKKAKKNPGKELIEENTRKEKNINIEEEDSENNKRIKKKKEKRKNNKKNQHQNLDMDTEDRKKIEQQRTFTKKKRKREETSYPLMEDILT